MEAPTIIERQDFYVDEDCGPDLNFNEQLEFPTLDGVLFPIVTMHADVIAPCSWLNGEEVSLTTALNNYPYPMTEENADSVIADVRDFLQLEVGRFENNEEVIVEIDTLNLKAAETIQSLKNETKTVALAVPKVPELKIAQKQEVEYLVRELSTSEAAPPQLDDTPISKEQMSVFDPSPKVKVLNDNVVLEKVELISESTEINEVHYVSEDLDDETFAGVLESTPDTLFTVAVDDEPLNNLSLTESQPGTDLVPDAGTVASCTEEFIGPKEGVALANPSEHQAEDEIEVESIDIVCQTAVQDVAEVVTKLSSDREKYVDDITAKVPADSQQAGVWQDTHEGNICGIDEDETNDELGTEGEDIELASLHMYRQTEYEVIETVKPVTFYSRSFEAGEDNGESSLSSVSSGVAAVHIRTRSKTTATTRSEMIDRAKVIGRSAMELCVARPLGLRKRRQVV